MKKIIVIGLILLSACILIGLISKLLTLPAWSQEKCEAPIWNVGEKWTYQDVNGGTSTTEIVEVKGDLYVVKLGRNLYAYDKKTMNAKYLIEEGKQVNTTYRGRKLLDFPLFVGKKWSDRRSGISVGPDFMDWLHEFRVEGVEEITTKAGTFKTYRIYEKQRVMSRRRAEGWIRYWYAPEAKNWVKREVEKTAFWDNIKILDTQLISFELK